ILTPCAARSSSISANGVKISLQNRLYEGWSSWSLVTSLRRIPRYIDSGQGSWITLVPFGSTGATGFAPLTLAMGLSRQCPSTSTSFRSLSGWVISGIVNFLETEEFPGAVELFGTAVEL